MYRLDARNLGSFAANCPFWHDGRPNEEIPTLFDDTIKAGIRTVVCREQLVDNVGKLTCW